MTGVDLPQSASDLVREWAHLARPGVDVQQHLLSGGHKVVGVIVHLVDDVQPFRVYPQHLQGEVELLAKPYLRPFYDEPEFVVRNVWRQFGGWWDGTASRLKPSPDAQVAAVVPPYKATEYVPRSYRKSTRIMARDIELAVVAADIAVRDAKLLTKGTAESPNAAELAASRERILAAATVIIPGHGPAFRPGPGTPR